MLGWSSEGLLALLLVSALRGRYLSKYPLFYVYLAGWFFAGLVRFFFFTFHLGHPNEYSLVYWYTQFLLVAGGYGVLWQIYAHTLDPFPGTAKMARVLVGTFFVTIVTQLFFKILTGHAEGLSESVLRLDRNLHSIQAGLIVMLISLVWYYDIPLGRNVRGLLLGHGLLITTRLITLALQSIFEMSLYAWWYYSEQICILASLVVWSIALRSYEPNPIPEHQIRLEQDYELLAHRTVQALSRARGYLARPFLP